MTDSEQLAEAEPPQAPDLPETDEPPKSRRRLPADVVALLVVAAAVVVANLPALLGIFHLDPLVARSELGRTITPGLLGGRPTIDPSNAFTSQAIGHLAALDLLHLHLPWWNPYEGTGMPLLGETQSAALFPPTLFTAFANGQLYEHLLLELVAGVCTYLLLRRLGVRRSAAVVGAVAFALNGKFAWFADATVNPLAFLPMLLLGIERAFDAAQTGRRGGWRLIALAGALTAYAGFPEVAYADVLMAVAWVIWRGVCAGRAQRSHAFLIRIALGAVTALLLAAPMLLAMGDYLSHAYLASHAGTALGTKHLPLSQLPQLLMPYVYGPVNAAHQAVWLMVGGYLSTVLVVLAALALVTPGRWGLKCVLVLWGLLVFSHMYGLPPGLGDALGVLPEVDRTEFYRYATAALELPVILLAALGVDDLVRAGVRRWRMAGCTLLAAAMIVAAALEARPLADSLQASVSHARDFYDSSIVWALLTVAVIVAFALVRRPRVRAALITLVVIVDAVALFAVPQFSAPRASRMDLAPVRYLRTHLGDQRFITFGPIRANYGSYFRLSSLRVDDFPPASFVQFVRSRLDPFERFVGFQATDRPDIKQEMLRHLAGYREAGVSYAVTHLSPALPPGVHGLRLVFTSATTRIYRLEHAAPFFQAPGCQTRTTALTAVRLTCERPTRLLRRETWLPGWTARIDGHATPIHRFDGLFQAVSVPAGEHEVTFGFTPPGMRWALLALLAGCLCLAIPTARGAVTAARDGLRGRGETIV